MATATVDQHENTWDALGFAQATLDGNLRVLRDVAADVARRLEFGGIHDGLAIADEDGHSVVVRTHRRLPRRVEEHADEVGSPQPGGSTLLLGTGTGERAQAILEALSEGAALWAHESDVGLLTLALARHDWRDALRTGRLRLLLGADLATTALPDDLDVVAHPLLAVDVVEPTRSPSAPADRAVVLRGELLQEELAAAFRQRARDVLILERGTTSLEGLAAELARFDASVAASINFEPELAELCGRLGIDYAAWEIDPTASPIPAASDAAATYTHVFTWRDRRVPEFEAEGWRAEFLPIAADPVRRAPLDVEPDDALVFVGSCMLSQGRRHEAALQQVARQDARNDRAWTAFFEFIERLDADLRRDPCRLDVPEVVEHEIRAHGLPQLVELGGEPALVSVLASERLAATKRIAIARSVQDLGLRVWGEEDWRDVLSSGTYVDEAGHDDELTRLLAGSGMTLDINRVYQPDIVTLRVFETGACGGFVLTEECDALRGLFDCDEIATWRDVDELRELIAHFRAHPDERHEMAARLHARVLREHTVAHRLDHMLDVVERRRGLRRR